MYKHKNGITLRKLEREDLPILKYLKNESWFGTHNTSFINSDDQDKWFNQIDGNKTIILIAVEEEYIGIPVGLYKVQNIDWVNRKYDSAHDVFEKHRGKGFSKRVLAAGIDFGFEVLNMHRIDTEVLENNIASLKSATWVGFEQEGVKRKCIHKCGEYLDSIVLGIVHEDWKVLPRLVQYKGVCNLSYTPKNRI